MDGWKQCFVLLLPLCVHAYNKETIVKAIRRLPDITPVCMSKDLGLIIFVKCRISTVRHRGEECHLLYNKLFDHECDSRFTLIEENQTVFIHLAGLKPVDSGNYTCECSYERGTHVTHLNITVESDEEGSAFSGRKFLSTLVILLSVAVIIIIIAVLISGLYLRRNLNRQNTRIGVSELSRSRTQFFVDQVDHYSNLQRPASSFYETISSRRHAEVDSDNIYATINQETDGKEEDFSPIYTIYESI